MGIKGKQVLTAPATLSIDKPMSVLPVRESPANRINCFPRFVCIFNCSAYYALCYASRSLVLIEVNLNK